MARSAAYTSKLGGNGPHGDLYYIGVVSKDPDSDYSVHFPDFPGCFSAGTTFEEMMSMGQEAISLHAESMVQDGELLPPPSDYETIKAQDPAEWDEFYKDSQIVRIPLVLRDPVKRVNISIREGLLDAIDIHAKEAGMTRSAYLAKGALSLMGVASR
ncbi:MAG: type II toxin-antitoxin system HicB family antitoxin [Pseudomonadota bacterium]